MRTIATLAALSLLTTLPSVTPAQAQTKEECLASHSVAYCDAAFGGSIHTLAQNVPICHPRPKD